MRRFHAIVLAAALTGSTALAASAHAAACGPSDPQGRFDGTVKQPDGSTLEVTLNLRCENGAYDARFFTNAGDFDGKDPRLDGGKLSIAFDNGVGIGSVTLTPTPDGLSGPVDLAGDKAVMTLTRAGAAWTKAEWTAHLTLTPAQWREDLAALARELPKRHASAFAFLSKAEFERRVAELDARIPSMNDDEVFVALSQLVNAIGDGHTGIVSPPDRQNMPLELSLIDGDFRVTAAAPGLERALGARVLKIGDTPIAEAHRRALTLTPTQELPQLREGRVVFYLARGLTLHGLAITPSRDRAVYTLQSDDGHVFTVEATGLGTQAEVAMTTLHNKTALRWKNPDDPFWCEPIADKQTLYCVWHSYQDLHAKALAMFAEIDRSKPRKLIIDMRDNGGGDNTVGYAELVKPLEERADLNRADRLFVLIGPLTFSAAMNNAAQFQDETHATLVGETIGEKPNSYQEPRQFRLPNSH